MATTLKKHSHKILTLCLTAFFCFGCSEDLFNGDNQTVNGLKEALRVGTNNATSMLGKEDGYLKDEAIKILLPEKAQTTFKVINAISSNSAIQSAVKAFGVDLTADLQTTLETAFNRAAEQAAPEAAGIFVSAISNMSISDGKDILFSSNNEAATGYLKTNTYSGLQTAFNPIINESMKNVNVTIGSTQYNTLDAWKFFAQQNNKLSNAISGNATIKLLISALPTEQKNTINSIQHVEEDLGNHVVGEALNGIFTKIGAEEYKIRTDASARVNDLLKNVFGQLDK